MEIQLRVVFLVLGLLILFGVAVDVYRRKTFKSRQGNLEVNRKQKFAVRNYSAERSDDSYVLEEVYAVDAINPTAYADKTIVDDLDQDSDLDLDLQLDSSSPLQDIAYTNSIDYLDSQIPQDPDQFTEQTNSEPSIQDVIAIFIMSRSPFGFNGDELYTAIGNAHFHLGKNNLFYRYEHDDGAGDALFSLVKAVEPGYFNVDILRQEHVPGITLLMLPSKVSNPRLALDKLIRAAKQIAFVLNGELLDHSRKALTLDTIEQYKQQIQTINA